MSEPPSTVRDPAAEDDLPELAWAVRLMADTLDEDLDGVRRPRVEELERYIDGRRGGASTLLRVPILAAWHGQGAECVVERCALVLRDALLGTELVLPWRSVAEVAGDGALLRVRSDAPRWRAAGHDGWFAVALHSEVERVALAEAIAGARRA